MTISSWIVSLTKNFLLIEIFFLIFKMNFFSIPARLTAGWCIAYCQGLSDQHQFAVLGQRSCTCGTAILFDPSLPGSTNPNSLCGLSASKSMIGSDANQGKFRNQCWNQIDLCTICKELNWRNQTFNKCHYFYTFIIFSNLFKFKSEWQQLRQ